jgi:hypothetical protein
VEQRILKGIFCLHPWRKEIEPQYPDVEDVLGSYVLFSLKMQMERMLKKNERVIFVAMKYKSSQCRR